MPTTGFRLWFTIVVIATAVTLIVGWALRLTLAPQLADPVAQAIGFTLSFALGWPWIRRQNPSERLTFPAFITFVAAIAVLMVVVRVRYIG